MLSLTGAKRVVVVGGCLGTAYIQLTQCPIAVEWARSLGADGLHIGILGAIPTVFLFMQLTAAMLARHWKYRKPGWLAVSLVQRVSFVPVAVGPWIWPNAPDGVWIWVLLALASVNHALLHFSTPLWLSWMSDYLPHAGLNRFWGIRQFWNHWAAAFALFVAGLTVFKAGLAIRDGFSWMLIVASVLGVVDILLFLPVEEPAARHGSEPRLRDILKGPFRHPEFRSYIGYSCFWQVSAMIGAPFISLYLLEYVHMDLFHVMLLWSLSWIGGTALSRRMGSMAEHYGGRPLLILCTAFKSLNMIALLCAPPNPDVTFWLLIPVFMIDAMLNAGIAIAQNNFLMKNSPAENRTMFIAAGTAYAGFTGGIASIAAGLAIRFSKGWHGEYLGLDVVNFHILFAISTVLRMTAAVLALRVREFASKGTRHVLREMAVAVMSQFAWLRPRRAARVVAAEGVARRPKMGLPVEAGVVKEAQVA